MIRRTTWVILAVFVVVLGLAWYLQRNGGAEGTQATPTPGSQPVFDFTENEVAGLRIEAAQGEAVALVRGAGGAWTLAEPQAEATDTERADSAVQQAAGLMATTTLESAPAPEATGLDPAAYLITLDLSDGSQRLLRVGKETPIETGYYVQVDDGPVQVVSKFSLDTLIELLENPPIPPTPTSAAPTEAVEAETPEGAGTAEAPGGEEATPSTPEATPQP